MKLLQNMTVMGHERVAFHQDPESGLRAVIAIHDTTLGNALGGTRRWCYASEACGILTGDRCPSNRCIEPASHPFSNILQSPRHGWRARWLRHY